MITITRTFRNNKLAIYLKTCDEGELIEMLHLFEEQESEKQKALRTFLQHEPAICSGLTQDIVKELRIESK